MKVAKQSKLEVHMQLTPDNWMGKGQTTNRNRDCSVTYCKGDNTNSFVNDFVEMSAFLKCPYLILLTAYINFYIYEDRWWLHMGWFLGDFWYGVGEQSEGREHTIFPLHMLRLITLPKPTRKALESLIFKLTRVKVICKSSGLAFPFYEKTTNSNLKLPPFIL